MRDPNQEPGTETSLMRSFTDRMIKQRSSLQNDLDSNWLITLSDVLSLLLVFFVVFTFMARSTKATASKEPAYKTAAAAAQAEAALTQKEVVNEMSEAIKRLRLENDVSVRAVDKGIVVTLKERITFMPGDAETLKTSEPMLDGIADIIKQHPGFQVEIEGHTDNVPISTPRYPSNWELSVARSTNVLKYFINYHGIEPSRLSVKGSADQKPLVDNSSPENRAQNRRVEIRLKEKGLG
jgi:chemotaxis protein MotB